MIESSARVLDSILASRGLEHISLHRVEVCSFGCLDSWYYLDLFDHSQCSVWTFVWDGVPAEFFFSDEDVKHLYPTIGFGLKGDRKKQLESVVRCFESGKVRPNNSIHSSYWLRYRPKRLDVSRGIAGLALMSEMVEGKPIWR